MKILLASETYYPSTNGAAYFTYRLANGLAQRGHRVFIIAPSKNHETTFVKEGEVYVYSIRSFSTILDKKYRVSPFSESIVRKIIKEIKPEIAHLQNHFFIGKKVLKVAHQLGVPIVGTHHFMPEGLAYYLKPPEWGMRMLKKIGWKQCINFYEKLNVVTAPTQTAVNIPKEKGLAKSIKVISNGIDLKKFHPHYDGHYLKERFGLPNNKPIILFVGRLAKEKKLDILIKAFYLVQKEMHCYLILVGIGKQEKRLKRLAKKLGVENNIKFTGFLPDEDLPNMYCVADLFVIPAITELQSLSTLEAMASGLPVIGANDTALPELVHDGKNGYLFTVDDYHELAEKIVKLLKNPSLRKEMSSESLKIVKNHSIEKTISAFENLYQKVIKNRRASECLI